VTTVPIRGFSRVAGSCTFILVVMSGQVITAEIVAFVRQRDVSWIHGHKAAVGSNC